MKVCSERPSGRCWSPGFSRLKPGLQHLSEQTLKAECAGVADDSGSPLRPRDRPAGFATAARTPFRGGPKCGRIHHAPTPSSKSADAEEAIRTGIVGAGFSATFHFEALSKVYGINVDVIGVYTKTPQGGKKYAREAGIRFPERLEALLDVVDVVHVCTPPVAHEPMAMAGLAARQVRGLRKAADRLLRRRLAIFTGTAPTSSRPWTPRWPACERILAAETRSRAGCCTPRTGSTPPRCRRSARSWRRPADRSSGSTARRPIAARTRSTMPTPPAAAAAC